MAVHAHIQMATFTKVIICLTVVTLSSSEDKIWKAKKEGKVEIFTLNKKLEPIRVATKATSRLDVFCYDGEWHPLHKRIPKLWTTANLKLAITSDDYELFTGYNESQVYHNYEEADRSYIKFTVPWRADNIQLSPFNKTCIGISTNQDYAVRFRINVLDGWLLSYMVIGILFFFSAQKLSRNVLFYYGTGISIGVLASLLIVVFIISRLMPWKKGAYVLFLGGWSVVLWSFRYIWDNYSSILESNWQYVVGYFLVAGVISFAMCYWKGPVTDNRSLNLIKWTIQGMALMLIYNSTQLQEVSVTIIIGVLTIHNFPRSFTSILQKIWRKLVPQRLRLLTEEEYLLQGTEETRRALEELREYCKSPNCDAWKTISRLTTPQRFAKWVEGDSHLSDDELMSFEEDPAPFHSTPEISEDEVDFQLTSQ